MIQIDTTNEQSLIPFDDRWCAAIRHALASESVGEAKISLAVVDDHCIRRLHAQFLDIDEPTDVLSFPLSAHDQPLEGEIVVSAETAARRAQGFGWRPEEELLLYVTHGALHLAGHDDTTPESRLQMRAAERVCLSHFGLEPCYDEPSRSGEVEPDPLDGGPTEK